MKSFLLRYLNLRLIENSWDDIFPIQLSGNVIVFFNAAITLVYANILLFSMMKFAQCCSSTNINLNYICVMFDF